jgi:uncharacterized membrane protein
MKKVKLVATLIFTVSVLGNFGPARAQEVPGTLNFYAATGPDHGGYGFSYFSPSGLSFGYYSREGEIGNTFYQYSTGPVPAYGYGAVVPIAHPPYWGVVAPPPYMYYGQRHFHGRHGDRRHARRDRHDHSEK